MAQSLRRMLAQRQDQKPEDTGETGFWPEICRRVKGGMVIPIIGNALRSDWIFEGPPGTAAPPPDAPQQTIDALLAESWAKEIAYPMRDRYELARVAQFKRVTSLDSIGAKRSYLTFLKKTLIDLAEAEASEANASEADEPDPDLIRDLRSQIDESTFADIAQELEYPKFLPNQEDPLRLLARLPLPVYVTTSYYDFMERALLAENRTPRTQVCIWKGDASSVEAEHRPDPAFLPDPKTPLVFHLHGLENYPHTLVLSEDDYLDFLAAVSNDNDQGRPVIPLYLRSALKQSSLIMLGYRLQDWEFRVMFRGVIRPWEPRLCDFNLVIQLDPERQIDILDCASARNYLEKYFEPAKFQVSWGSADTFISQLWDEWNRWRQGQR
jgi:hypothetical protein